jgi:hypothetical protein
VQKQNQNIFQGKIHINGESRKKSETHLANTRNGFTAGMGSWDHSLHQVTCSKFISQNIHTEKQRKNIRLVTKSNPIEKIKISVLCRLGPIASFA